MEMKMFKLTHFIALISFIASGVLTLVDIPTPSIIQAHESNASVSKRSCEQINRLENDNLQGVDA